jgi:hypothetical protein
MMMALSRSCWQYFESADIVEGVFGLGVKTFTKCRQKKVSKGKVSKT